MWGALSTLGGYANTAANAFGGWGNVAQLGMGLYGASRSKKGGEKAARRAVQAGTPTGYGTGSMWGSTTVDPRTKQMQFNMAQNPFAQMFNQGGLQSFANAYAAPGQAYYGAAPEIAQAAQGMYGPELDAASAERLGLLRQLAAPEEQRQTTGLNDRLYAMGRLGGTGGGIEQEALARAQSSADLQRQLASADWAQNRAQSRFTSALQAVGAGQAQQQQAFGMGQGSIGGLQDMFRQLMAQGQLGVGAGQGSATPSDLAALQAGARTAPGAWDAFGSALQNSNVFGSINNWLGGGLSPVTTTAQRIPVPGQGPIPGGYSNVRIPEGPAMLANTQTIY